MLYTISAIVWAMTLAILVLYLRQHVSLKTAMTSFGILTQLTDSARIVHMAMTQPPGFNETIVFNQIISLALIIYLVMALSGTSRQSSPPSASPQSFLLTSTLTEG